MLGPRVDDAALVSLSLTDDGVTLLFCPVLAVTEAASGVDCSTGGAMIARDVPRGEIQTAVFPQLVAFSNLRKAAFQAMSRWSKTIERPLRGLGLLPDGRQQWHI